jgi:hypothetical protein
MNLDCFTLADPLKERFYVICNTRNVTRRWFEENFHPFGEAAAAGKNEHYQKNRR